MPAPLPHPIAVIGASTGIAAQGASAIGRTAINPLNVRTVTSAPPRLFVVSSCPLSPALSRTPYPTACIARV